MRQLHGSRVTKQKHWSLWQGRSADAEAETKTHHRPHRRQQPTPPTDDSTASGRQGDLPLGGRSLLEENKGPTQPCRHSPRLLHHPCARRRHQRPRAWAGQERTQLSHGVANQQPPLRGAGRRRRRGQQRTVRQSSQPQRQPHPSWRLGPQLGARRPSRRHLRPGLGNLERMSRGIATRRHRSASAATCWRWAGFSESSHLDLAVNVAGTPH